MTELKTLKDLKRYTFHDQARKLKTGYGSKGRNVIMVATFDELKAEAMKWVKNIKPIITEDFMRFFNLTEEDLKKQEDKE